MHSGSELSIKVDDVSLAYKPVAAGLRRAVRRLRGQDRDTTLVEAVREVTFEVPAGSAYSIIGANGAGKSTLLRAIAGVIPPVSGSITVWGRARLLAMGMGFRRPLTGRENVYLGGLAAGLDRAQVLDAMDDIVAFADLGRFIDMPVATYSSGMYARLAFSVVTHTSPEILLLDEALSAGDAAFRDKARDKVLDLKEGAETIVMVSHSLGQVLDVSDRVAWLHRGRLVCEGTPDDVVGHYRAWAKQQVVPPGVSPDIADLLSGRA